MKKTARILLALCACMLIGGNAAMAQDRMEESSATVKALYGTENPCSIKGAPELGEIMQKFIYSPKKYAKPFTSARLMLVLHAARPR